jgi:tetratricopeptide (TPR) repeat protein
VWTPSAEITYALRAWDAMAVKQSLAQVERLAASIPSLKLWVARTHGAHLVLRQRYAEALPWLEQCLEERPKAAIGWGRSLGSLARALNGLGQHPRALEIVEQTLAQLCPDDLSFPAMYLGLQIEGALAELGMGNATRAIELLDALLTRHQHGGVLTRGQLHEARLRAALALDDFDGAERHFRALSQLYTETRAPSLLARVDQLARQMRRAMQRDTDEQPSDLYDLPDDTDLSKIESTLAGAQSVTQLAERALSLLAQRVGASDGFLWLVDGDTIELSATLKDAPLAEELDQWARSRIADCAEIDVTQTLHQTEESEQDPDVFQAAHACFKLHLLSVPGSAGQTAVGAVALPFEGAAQFLDPRLTQEVAAYIGRARAETV